MNVGFRGTLIAGGGFLLYVVGSSLATVSEEIYLPYSHLTLESDPFFTIGGALNGFFIVLGTGSLVLYYFLVGVESERSQLALLTSLVGSGCGAAVLRWTLREVLHLLIGIL